MKLRRAIMVVVSAGVLLLVFAAYQRPEIVLTLADQLWSCF